MIFTKLYCRLPGIPFSLKQASSYSFIVHQMKYADDAIDSIVQREWKIIQTLNWFVIISLSLSYRIILFLNKSIDDAGANEIQVRSWAK